MHRLFIPTKGPQDWRAGLADPDRHWRRGKSAYELAVAWEAARDSDRGLPRDVAELLDTRPEFAGARLLLGIPEHKVQLDGGGHPSQTDLWGLLATRQGTVSMAVEGKAGEPFGEQVSQWLAGAPPASGKPARLRQLCSLLGITEDQARTCRYQLLHRTAAAILEAQRFGVPHGLLLVHSFSPHPDGFSDFSHFAEQLEAEVADNQVAPAGRRGGVDLWLAWVSSSPAPGQGL